MSAVRKISEFIYYNPDTGSYTVFDEDGRYVGSVPYRDIAEKWAPHPQPKKGENHATDITR